MAETLKEGAGWNTSRLFRSKGATTLKAPKEGRSQGRAGKVFGTRSLQEAMAIVEKSGGSVAEDRSCADAMHQVLVRVRHHSFGQRA